MTQTIPIMLIMLCVSGIGLGQSSIPVPRFEVDSVKRTKDIGRTAGFKIRNGRFGPDGSGAFTASRSERVVGENITVKLLVAIAYGLHDFQIEQGPNWIDSYTFDVEGKAQSGEANADQVTLMLQSLLADRFSLAVRSETKDIPIYALVIGKNGPKIKPSADQTPGNALGPHGSVKIGAGSIVGTSVPLPLIHRSSRTAIRSDHCQQDRTNWKI